MIPGQTVDRNEPGEMIQRPASRAAGSKELRVHESSWNLNSDADAGPVWPDWMRNFRDYD